MSKKEKSKVADRENEEESRPDEEAAEEASAAAEGGEGSQGADSGGEPSLDQRLEAVREESRENYEKYLRTVADWENYRRRMAREKDELRRYAVASFIEELLPVLDNFDLGLKTAENHPEAAGVTEGFKMVAEQIRGLLASQGVEAIVPDGEPFDPHNHESVSYQPDPERPEGVVLHVVRPGYKLNDRLLRPAAVVVSSGPAEGKAESSPESTGAGEESRHREPGENQGDAAESSDQNDGPPEDR